MGVEVSEPSAELPPSVELTVHRSPGFSGDLWSWSVQVVRAPSGRCEVRWTTFDTTKLEREHRERARVLPEWSARVLHTLESIDFAALPPTAGWRSPMDDLGELSVSLRIGAQHSQFVVPDWPKAWPKLPAPTRAGLQEITAILDPIARSLHRS